MRRPKTSLATWITATIFIACVSILGVELWHEQSERRTEINGVEQAATNLARSLVQQAEDTIELANTAIVAVIQSIADQYSSDKVSSTQAAVLRQTAELPRIQGLFVFDESGQWRAGSVPAGALGIDPNRIVQVHRSSSSLEPQVMIPVRDQGGGQWLLTVSRRLNGRDGSFAGVVFATIDIDFFDALYSTFDVGADGSTVLFGTGGNVLARHPYDPAFIGRDVSKSALFTEQLPRRDHGFFRLTSPLDGMVRIAAFKRGRRFPVGILVALGEAEALASWRASAFKRVSVAVGFVVLLGSLGIFAHRSVSKLQRARAALADSELNFRLLAENSSDVVARIDRHGIRRYVSPSASVVFGKSSAAP